MCCIVLNIRVYCKLIVKQGNTNNVTQLFLFVSVKFLMQLPIHTYIHTIKYQSNICLRNKRQTLQTQQLNNKFLMKF